MQQTVVTAEEISPHIRRMLRTLLPHELDRFEELIESGSLIGRYWDRCIFATLLDACGHKVRDGLTREETFEEVRKLARARFGIRLQKSELNSVEIFCFEVRGNHTSTTSPVLAHLLVLTDEIRRENEDISTLSRPDVEENESGVSALFV
jgi:hypothetical protein